MDAGTRVGVWCRMVVVVVVVVEVAGVVCAHVEGSWVMRVG